MKREGSSRGRGRGDRRGGPQLPFKLTKELFDSTKDAGGGGNHRGRGDKLSRKDRRKQDRQTRKAAPLPKSTRHSREDGPDASITRNKTSHHLRRREDVGDGGSSQPAVKRQRLDHRSSKDKAHSHSKSSKPGSSKFEELLQPSLQANGASGIQAELEYQRQLAKKLGMKASDADMGGDDGLDDLLNILGEEGSSDTEDSDTDNDVLDVEIEHKGYSIGGRGSKMERARINKKAKQEPTPLEKLAQKLDRKSKERTLVSKNEESSSFSSEEESAEEEESENDDEEGDLDLLNSSEDEDLVLDDDDDFISVEEEEERKESDDEEESENISIDNEDDKQQQQRLGASSGRYLPPAARAAAAAANTNNNNNNDNNNNNNNSNLYNKNISYSKSEEALRVEKRVRGLLNRLAEANIQGIVTELASLHDTFGRRLLSDAVCTELVAAAAEGPRASDRFAAVVAACIAGLAGTIDSSEIIANFIARVGDAYESGRSRSDSLTCHNLALVLAHLYTSGALKSDLLYSLLDQWTSRFTELDVSAMATLLKTAGLKLRASDPERMKDFVVQIHAAAADAKGAGTMTPRAQVMLDVVVDIKNNRSREHKGVPVVTLAPAVYKWLRGTGVSGVAVGGINWKKVLNKDRRGEWWFPTAADAAAALAAQAEGGKASKAAAALFASEASSQDAALLKLAAQMRMNTDTRRAVFCVVMGSEDCMDALEKLLRINLKGTQEREIVRVTVECCLHEAAYNPYYAHLLTKLCEASKAHKMTFQYCLWDHFKELPMLEVRRLTNLAKLTASGLATAAVPSTMLKVVDFKDRMSSKEVLFWRLVFENVFASCKSAEDSKALFTRIATQEQLAELKSGLAGFLKTVVGPWLASKEPGKGQSDNEEQLALLLKRCRTAEKVLGK